MFTDPFQLAKFHDAHDSGPRQAIQSLMFADLYARLANRELEAIGYQIEPNPQRELNEIPSHIFGDRPNYKDCLEDVVKSRGWHFVDVRVCKVSIGISELSSNDASSKRGGGRKSTYDKSKKVLEEMYRIESNSEKSAEQLHRDFKEAFEQQFSVDKYQVFAPSERTLRDHIKRYRQELAETRKK
jgi:hypothetical protein